MGAAVYSKDKRHNCWKNKTIFLGKKTEVLDAQLWAIVETLDVTAKKTKNSKDTHITVLCDSQKALTAI